MGKLIAAILAGVVMFLVMITVFALVGAFFLKLAWGYAFTGFYFLPEPTWVQAIAMNFIAGMLFKGTSISASRK